jgi:hypothetical protein
MFETSEVPRLIVAMLVVLVAVSTAFFVWAMRHK